MKHYTRTQLKAYFRKVEEMDIQLTHILSFYLQLPWMIYNRGLELGMVVFDYAKDTEMIYSYPPCVKRAHSSYPSWVLKFVTAVTSKRNHHICNVKFDETTRDITYDNSRMVGKKTTYRKCTIKTNF